MKRIVLDQGLPATAAVILRNDGWDAVHEFRVIITLDRDFPQILALIGAARPSVVLIRQQRLRAAGVAALIESIWQRHEAAMDRGCVVKASVRGTHARLLPLK